MNENRVLFIPFREFTSTSFGCLLCKRKKTQKQIYFIQLGQRYLRMVCEACMLKKKDTWIARCRGSETGKEKWVRVLPHEMVKNSMSDPN